MMDDDSDFDGPDEEERKTRARRLFTYAKAALVAGAKVDRIMVNYPAFKDALMGMDRVFQLGRELSVQQGIMITGASGTGKTALVRHFLSSLPKAALFDDGYGAIAIRLYRKPAVGQVVGGLLRRLRYPFPQVNSQTLDIKRNVLVDALRQKGTRLIFVDEAQYLLTQARHSGRYDADSNVTDLLRELMDEVPLGLALMGAPEIAGLHEVDEHLANRISAKFELKGLDAPAVWLGFSKTFAKQSGDIDLSLFADRTVAGNVCKATDGNLRSFKRIVVEAVMVAADDGASAVSMAHLSLAHDRVQGKDSGKENPYVA